MKRYLVYIDFAEDGSILYIGATGDYTARMAQHAVESPWIFDTAHTAMIDVPSKAAAHDLEMTLVAAHNPPNNWLGRSVPNPRLRPTREENVAAVQARRVGYLDSTVLGRRCREAMDAVGVALDLPA